MATIGVRIFQHHKKKDGTYNVKISVCHKRKTAYIRTSHYLSFRKLNSDLSIKSYVVNRALFKVLDDYREMISMFEDRLDMLNAKELRDLLVDNFKSIDFLSYCKAFVTKLAHSDRKESAANYRTCYYSLIDFFNRDRVGFNEITVNTIEDYQSYLKEKRILLRPSRDGSFNKKVSSGLSDNSISGYLIHFKAFFNSGKKFYNNNSYGITRIKNKRKRKDNAFISIKLIPAARVLLHRYKDINKRYKTVGNLNKAINKGLKQIGQIIGRPELTFYAARHTFASLARNGCRLSKDDVAAALNHVDQTLRITDIYIAKDWSIIDRVQRSVVKYINRY